MAANAIPDGIFSPELEEKLAKEDGEKPVPLTMQQCQKLLMEVLMNNGSIGKLDGPGWTKQAALKAKRCYWNSTMYLAWRKMRWAVLTPPSTLSSCWKERMNHSRRDSGELLHMK